VKATVTVILAVPRQESVTFTAEIFLDSIRSIWI